MTLARTKLMTFTLVASGVWLAFWAAAAMPEQYCPPEPPLVRVLVLTKFAGALLAGITLGLATKRRYRRLWLAAAVTVIVTILTLIAASFPHYFNIGGATICAEGETNITSRQSLATSNFAPSAMWPSKNVT